MEIAGGSGRSSLGRLGPRVADLWLPLHRLVIVGFLAIAASGLVAWGLDAMFGDAFVAGDAPGVTYTPARCADFAEYAPAASTCERAAATHHAGEVIEYRIATLVFALIAGVAYVGVRRTGRFRDGAQAAFEPTVGATAFGLAGFGLLALAANQWVLGTDAGAGQFLSAAIVAIPLAVFYAARVYRAMDAGDSRD
ncbi:MAG: hypothetical protein ACXVPR_00330 [Actinomycetota bacterium]